MEYTDAELLDDIRDLAAKLGHPPSSQEYRGQGSHLPTTYYNRFGSWQEALEAAGFDVDASRHQPSPMEAALRDELHRLTEKLGSPPSAREMDTLGEYGSRTYVRRFGSWDDVLAAANLERDPAAPRISEAALIAELQGLHDELGTKPTSTDVAAHGEYSVSTYQRRFGSWSAAVTATFDVDSVASNSLSGT